MQQEGSAVNSRGRAGCGYLQYKKNSDIIFPRNTTHHYDIHMAFKGNGGFGGGRRDFGGGGRPFQPRGNFGGQDKQRFEAICADCGTTCEVPFRPNGKKPVYCKDCLPKHQDQDRGPREFSRPPQRFDREAPRQFERREAPRPAAPDTRIDALMREVSMLGNKLDMLAGAISKISAPAVAEKAAKPEKAPIAAPVKAAPAPKAAKAKKVAKKAKK